MPESDNHLALLRSRRSRRRFLADPVPLEPLLRAVEAATLAPSGANTQPWEFLFVPHGERRDSFRPLCEAADRHFHESAPPWLKDFLAAQHIAVEKIYFETAPWLVCVFARRNLPYWLPSVWLGIANFVNQIHAEGLATVVYTPTLGRAFNTLVGVDPDWSFQAMLPVGVPDPSERVEDRPRVGAMEKARVLGPNGPEAIVIS